MSDPMFPKKSERFVKNPEDDSQVKENCCGCENPNSFLYLENHALDAWFSKAYSGEDDKALQIG